MKRAQSAEPRKQLEMNEPWSPLYDDLAGIDSDIERLLGAMQRERGATRALASAELVRRLSFAA